MYDLGSRLKNIRIQRGLTQKDLATKINKSISAISSYESNVQIPPVDVLVSIAFVLNISLDYLVGMDQSISYSTRNLTTEQRTIIELLYKEFLEPSNTRTKLSLEQIEIIQRIILLFSS